MKHTVLLYLALTVVQGKEEVAYRSMDAKCFKAQPDVAIGKSLYPKSLDESNLLELTSDKGQITGAHRVRSIKLCKTKQNQIQQIQLALAIPDTKANRWHRPVALNGFGLVEGAKCDFVQIQPNDYVSQFKTQWDDVNGITGVSIHTQKGAFKTLGKGMPDHYQHSFSFDENNQLMGLHGISSKKGNNIKLEKIGVISMDVNCQNGSKLIDNSIKSSNQETGVLISALILTVGIIICFVCTYCCHKKTPTKTFPMQQDPTSPVTPLDLELQNQESQNTQRIAFDKLTMDSGRENIYSADQYNNQQRFNKKIHDGQYNESQGDDIDGIINDEETRINQVDESRQKLQQENDKATSNLNQAVNRLTSLQDHHVRARSLLERVKDAQQKLIVKESELSLKKEIEIVSKEVDDLRQRKAVADSILIKLSKAGYTVPPATAPVFEVDDSYIEHDQPTIMPTTVEEIKTQSKKVIKKAFRKKRVSKNSANEGRASSMSIQESVQSMESARIQKQLDAELTEEIHKIEELDVQKRKELIEKLNAEKHIQSAEMELKIEHAKEDEDKQELRKKQETLEAYLDKKMDNVATEQESKLLLRKQNLKVKYDKKKETMKSQLEQERANSLLKAPPIYREENQNESFAEIMHSESSADDKAQDELREMDENGQLTPLQNQKNDPNKTHFGAFDTMKSLDDTYLSQDANDQIKTDNSMVLSQFLPMVNHNASIEGRQMYKTMTQGANGLGGLTQSKIIKKKTIRRKNRTADRQTRQISLLKYLQVLKLNPYMEDVKDSALNTDQQRKVKGIKSILNSGPTSVENKVKKSLKKRVLKATRSSVQQ